MNRISKILLKRILIFISFVVIVIFVSLAIALGSRNEDLGYTNITNSEAYEQLRFDQNIILLDVRDLDEHNEIRIPNSILISLDDLEGTVQNVLTDKDATIFVYCKSGVRSRNASRILANLGYNNIYNLEGINNWDYGIEVGE
jgi:rhodanese-related sulfurtransferase